MCVCVWIRRQLCGVPSLLHLHGFQGSSSLRFPSFQGAPSLAPSLYLTISLLFLDLSYTGIPYPDLLVCLEGLAICPSKNKYQFIRVKWAEELEYEARVDSTEHVSGPSLQQRHRGGKMWVTNMTVAWQMLALCVCWGHKQSKYSWMVFLTHTCRPQRQNREDTRFQTRLECTVTPTLSLTLKVGI